MFRFNRRAAAAYITNLVVIFGGQQNVFAEMRKIILPKFSGESIQVVDNSQLYIGLYAVHESEFAIYPSRKKNHVLIGKNISALVVIQVFFIQVTVVFRKTVKIGVLYNG